MRLSYYLDKTAERPLFSFEIADPAAVRKRAAIAGCVAMGIWLLCMWANTVWNGLVPFYFSFPFAAAGCAGFYLIAMIDEESRREKATAVHERQITEASPHEQ